MTGMEHAIEQAARIADDILCTDPQVAREMFGDEPDRIARALAEAGLLAPSPLRKEWGVRWHPDDPAEDIWDHYIDRRDAESGAGDEGEVVFRYVTDGRQE